MKKTMGRLLCIAVLLLLCACSSKAPDSVGSEDKSKQEMSDLEIAVGALLPLEESDLALQMYAAAVANEIPIVDPVFGTDCFRDYIRAINGHSDEISVNGKAVLDIDRDGTWEWILSVNSAMQIEQLLLKYIDGTVYVWGFYFRNCYRLNTDGSFAWNAQSATSWSYGESVLTFRNGTPEETKLWHIENDGTPDAAYYLEGKSVTEEVLRRYLEEHPKTEVEYLPYALNFEETSRG